MIVNDDEDEDFGGGPTREVSPPSNVIPFFRQKPDASTADRWKAEIERAKHYQFVSPLGALGELARKRKLPRLPLPWSDFAARCVLYPGEMMGVAGPSGGGKTSFAIEIARHVIAEGVPVLWLPLELDAPQVNIRIVANIEPCHMYKVRDEWPLDQISQRLLQLNDRWRYVDFIHGEWERQVEALRVAIQIAKRIYGRPPLWIIDYVGKFGRGGSSGETRALLADVIERLRMVTIDEECFGIALSQTSRGNSAMLTGKVDLESAADAIGVSAETSELEHAVAVNVALNVFKADDAPSLDSHVLVTKARNTGREGRIGFRFHKPGGRWEQLNSLPATPGEVTKEVARVKKDRRDVTPATIREELNAQKASAAAQARARSVYAVLARCGALGMETGGLAKGRGVGGLRNALDALEILQQRGDVERIGDDRWRVAGRMIEQ